jgi:hypothetical protein
MREEFRLGFLPYAKAPRLFPLHRTWFQVRTTTTKSMHVARFVGARNLNEQSKLAEQTTILSMQAKEIPTKQNPNRPMIDPVSQRCINIACSIK